jgi:hypothetical protein
MNRPNNNVARPPMNQSRPATPHNEGRPSGGSRPQGGGGGGERPHGGGDKGGDKGGHPHGR